MTDVLTAVSIHADTSPFRIRRAAVSATCVAAAQPSTEPAGHDAITTKEKLLVQTADQNKATIRSLNEAYNDRDRERFESFYADLVTLHVRNSDRTLDRDMRWDIATSFYEAFPDFSSTIEMMVAEGDQVVIRCTYSGTHHGPYLGIEPTGKWIEWTLVQHYRLRDGVIVEAWPLFDALHLYAQLGAIDPPEEVYRKQR